ncbi:MAG: hypothetical protein ABEK50_00735 [bacterium]
MEEPVIQPPSDGDLNEGAALITVLWILGLLGALVGAMAMTSYFNIKVSSSISQSGRSQKLARSGLKAWMANLRADGLEEDSGVVITEVMSHNPNNTCGGMRISKVCNGDSDNCGSEEWIEVFNAGTSGRLGQIREADDTDSSIIVPEDAGPNDRKNILLAPGEYFIVTSTENALASADVESDDFYLNSNQGGIRLIDTHGNHCDAVGWDKSGDESDVFDSSYYENRVIDNTSEPDLRRDTQPPSSSDVPADTDENPSNFTADVDFAPRTGYDSDLKNTDYGRNTGPDTGAYVELYNTSSDSKDLTDDFNNYQFYDSHDSDGDEVSFDESEKYDLNAHPHAPTVSDSNLLPPDHYALVLHPDSDSEALGIADRINRKNVRMYRTEDDPFFYHGLHNIFNETITIEPPVSSEYDSKVVVRNGWDTYGRVNLSRTKKTLHLANRAEHWPLSPYEGTPSWGITQGVDHFGESWGWGGSVEGSVQLNERIYLPSLSNNGEGNNYGYFKFKRIEDESGKIDLLTRGRDSSTASDTWELTSEMARKESGDAKIYRALSTSSPNKVQRAYEYPKGNLDIDTHWLSYGEIFTNRKGGTEPFLTGTLGQFKEYTHVYTGYREESNRKHLNINTAPYESLLTIPIKSYDGSNAPNFVTHDMALEIIKQRNGGQPADKEESDYYIIPNESYGDDSSEGLQRYDPICSDLKDLHSNFNCSTFRQHTTFKSEGVFRAVILGVAQNDEGDTIGTTTLDAVVDRRPLQNSNPPEILYLRTH